MIRKLCSTLAVLVVTASAALALAENKPKASAPPEVTGAWVGVWGPYQPKPAVAPAKDKCKRLDCKVEVKGGVWHATFEGECGRPYKYTITMKGRRAGDVVLFKGTVDLGEKDGGVYDWIGKADAKEFVGFYTSAHYTGFFRLTRANGPAAGGGGK